LVEDSLGLHKISEKFFRNSFFPEIPRKNIHRIWEKTRQISGKTDESSSTKKNKKVSHTNEPWFQHLAVINKKFIANIMGRIWASNLSQNSVDTVTDVW